MTLAIHGGESVRKHPMPARPQYEIAERNAANTVVASGNLSGFLAEVGDQYYGGPYVQGLESAFCERFGVKYAVAMNSGTSCLFAAVTALNLDPRDEVIVTPWSMSASATCVLAAGAVPAFADIDPYTYTLDPMSVERRINRYTKAIVAVDLFGRPALWSYLKDIADHHGLRLVEDAAQAPGAYYGGRPCGTLADVGVFSLNRHKQIQCGEGGVAVTDDPEIASFLWGYRNHGEVLNYRQGWWGGNLRMGEVEAAIAEVQLSRLDELIEPRVHNARRLNEALGELEGIRVPEEPLVEGSSHVYYLYAVRVPGDSSRWAQALSAEGVAAGTYVPPLYHLPVLRGHARRDDTCDWNGWYGKTEACYREVVVHPHVHAGMTDEDIDDIIETFRKVWQHREEL